MRPEGRRDPAGRAPGELLGDDRVGDQVRPGPAVGLLVLRSEQPDQARLPEHHAVREVTVTFPFLGVGPQGSVHELPDHRPELTVLGSEQSGLRDRGEPGGGHPAQSPMVLAITSRMISSVPPPIRSNRVSRQARSMPEPSA